MKHSLWRYGFRGALAAVLFMGILIAAGHLLPRANTLRHISGHISEVWTLPLIRLLDAIIPQPPFGHDSFFSNIPIMAVYLTLYALLTGFVAGMIVYLLKKAISR